jgi:hypothetical protein
VEQPKAEPQRERGGRERREPRHEQQARHPRPEQAEDARGQAGKRSQQPKRDGGQRENASVGFADNIPAFLRRSSRPAKVANE